MTRLPASIRECVEKEIGATGRAHEIVAVDEVAGGCINRGCRIQLDSGAVLFLKWNPRAPLDVFEAEADGLAALHGAVVGLEDALTVPAVVALGNAPDGAWLVLDYVAPARPRSDSDARLGRALAHLHGATTGVSCGWHRNNWIGALPQDNTPRPEWPTFWRDARIGPQLSEARQRGFCAEAIFDRLMRSIPKMDRPLSLLHGDLWSGNAYIAQDGTPVVIDPAVYRGDAEVDLAMTELFGGFSTAFYDAYDVIRPIDSGYRAFRRDLYQLFYLLVHVNLFGASYESGARTAASRVVSVVS